MKRQKEKTINEPTNWGKETAATAPPEALEVKP